MAIRTFKADGTSRAWSLTTTWVEGVVPTAADDVVFSTNVASSILVIDGTSVSPSLCRSIDTTNYTKTITFATGKQLNVGTSTSGAFKLTAGMTFNIAGLIKFVSTTTGNNITWGGYQSQTDGITFDGVGGGWQFQDAAASGNNGVTITLTNGALDTNNQSVTGFKFSSNNSNTRSLTMGTTTWACAVNANGLVWDIGTATGMTLSAASSTITAAGVTTTASTFAGGGLTYGTVSITTPTTAVMSWTGANTFGTLTMSMGASTKTNLSGHKLSANQTVTGTFTANGSSAILRNFIYSDTTGTARTITAATVTVTQTDFKDITGAGAGSWNLSAVTGGSGDCGGNSGITFNTPKNCYMKTAVSVNWSASNWFTASGGSTPISPVIPLPQDTAFFDANSVTAGSKVITLDEPRIPATNFTNVANSPTFTTSSAYEIYGSLTFVSGMTLSGSGAPSFCGRASNTYTSGGKTWPSGTLTLDAPGGKVTVQDSLTFAAGIDMTGLKNGTMDLNGKALTVRNITFTGAATLLLVNSTVTCTALSQFMTVNVGGGTLDISGSTITASSITTPFNVAAAITIKTSATTTIAINGGTITFQTSGSSGGGGKILASSIIQGLGVV